MDNYSIACLTTYMDGSLVHKKQVAVFTASTLFLKRARHVFSALNMETESSSGNGSMLKGCIKNSIQAKRKLL